MIDILIEEIKKIRYFVAFMATVIVFFVYLHLAGKRFTGSDSEKFVPKGYQRKHHK